MVAFGYGISLDVEHLRFGAFDQDRSPESRSLIEAFTASPRYFDQMPPIGTSEEFDRRFRSGDLQVAIEIPPGFGRDLQIGRTPDVAVWLDGSMPFRAETTKGYVTALAAQYLIAQRTLRNSPASTINPLRLSYSLLSDRNPMMRVVAQLAEQALAERTVPVDNPFVALQQQFSKAVIDVLNLYRDMRDQLVEQTFHVIYGSPVVQAAFGISQNDGPPRPRPGLLPSTQAATEAEIHRLRGRVAKKWIARGSCAGARLYRQGSPSRRRAYLRCPAEAVAGASGGFAGRVQGCSVRAVGDPDDRRASCNRSAATVASNGCLRTSSFSRRYKRNCHGKR
jgi:hypothetical protein